jgi:hypothetical protein
MTATSDTAPMLGEILAAARSQSAAFAAWLQHHEPQLHARLDAALVPGATHIGRIREAVGDFVHDASDEDWVQLVSAARDGANPGLAALRVMLDWSLAQR